MKVDLYTDYGGSSTGFEAEYEHSTEYCGPAISDKPAGVASSQPGASGLHRRHAAGCSAVMNDGDSCVVMFGGYNGSVMFSDTLINGVEVTPSGAIPSARLGHRMSRDHVNNRVLLFGGYDGTTFLNDVHALTVVDSATASWSLVVANSVDTGAPSGRSLSGMLVHGNRLWVFGGLNSTGYLGDVWVFDLVTNNWAGILSSDVLLTPRIGALLLPHSSDGVVIFGGYDGINMLNDMVLVTANGQVTMYTGTPVIDKRLIPSARAFMMVDHIAPGFVVLTSGVDRLGWSKTKAFNGAFAMPQERVATGTWYWSSDCFESVIESGVTSFKKAFGVMGVMTTAGVNTMVTMAGTDVSHERSVDTTSRLVALSCIDRNCAKCSSLDICVECKTDYSVIDGVCQKSCVDVVIDVVCGTKSSEISFTIIGSGNSILASQGPADMCDGCTKTFTYCLTGHDFTLNASDSAGDGWNDGSYTIKTPSPTIGFGVIKGPVSFVGMVKIEPFSLYTCKLPCNHGYCSAPNTCTCESTWIHADAMSLCALEKCGDGIKGMM